MRYDPSITQKVKVASDSDTHRLKDLMWRAIENHDEAVQDHETRVRLLEIAEQQRLTEVKVKDLMEQAQIGVRKDQQWITWLLRGVIVVGIIDSYMQYRTHG